MKSLLRFKSIYTKIMFGFILLILLVFGMGILSYFSIAKINDDVEEIIAKQMPLLVLDEDLSYNMSQTTAMIGSYFLFKDDKVKEKIEDNIGKSSQLEEELLELGTSESLLDLIELKSEWNERVVVAMTEFDLGNEDKAIAMMRETRPLTNEITDSLEQLAIEKENNIIVLGEDVMSLGKK